jgi:hypothetical protein
MLFDPKWEAKVEPLSLAGLIAWLETKPPKGRYYYIDNCRCLIGQFLAALGYENVCTYSKGFLHGPREEYGPGEEEAIRDGTLVYFPAGFDRIAISGEHKYGVALERARALNKNADAS